MHSCLCIFCLSILALHFSAHGFLLLHCCLCRFRVMMHFFGFAYAFLGSGLTIIGNLRNYGRQFLNACGRRLGSLAGPTLYSRADGNGSQGRIPGVCSKLLVGRVGKGERRPDPGSAYSRRLQRFFCREPARTLKRRLLDSLARRVATLHLYANRDVYEAPYVRSDSKPFSLNEATTRKP